VTVETLVAAGVCARARDGVKLLGQGELKAAVHFEVFGASKGATEAVEKLGGSVKTLAPQAEAPASA
jgi:large subunit ribosomal protein L15